MKHLLNVLIYSLICSNKTNLNCLDWAQMCSKNLDSLFKHLYLMCVCVLLPLCSLAYQRMSWEALKKSINGLINKVNVSNIVNIIQELLQENIVRGR